MRQRKKLICILLSALMLMGALSGCSEEKQEDSGRFTVPVAVCGTVDSLDPAMNRDAALESVFYALYENLLRVRADEDGAVTLEPAAAKEYRTVENYDGTVDYVFTLRSTARWSDGARLRARDFVYAWRRLADPATGSPNAALLSVVQGYDAVRETGDAGALAVRAENDSTFRVTLSAPCAYFLSDVCTAVATMPLRSDAIAKDPLWAASNTALCDGPYRVSLWSKEDYIQLRRNDSYYDSRAVSPDALRFLFAEDDAAAWALYESGEADYVTAPPARTGGARYLPRRSVTCVLYNHMSDVFSNAHVRRAFDLTLDRAALAEAAGDAARPATGFVPHGVAGASEEEPFRSDGDAFFAADEAAYTKDRLEAEGELRLGGYWGGVGFPEVACLYVLGPGARDMAAAVTGLWRDTLNVEVAFEGLSREAFDERLAAGDYDLAIDTLAMECSDAMAYLEPFAGLDEGNVLRYASTPYELLLGVAASSRSMAARTAFLHDAEALLLDDAALSPLFFGGTSCLLRETLTGVRHDLRGNAYFTAVRSVPQGS